MVLEPSFRDSHKELVLLKQKIIDVGDFGWDCVRFETVNVEHREGAQAGIVC